MWIWSSMVAFAGEPRFRTPAAAIASIPFSLMIAAHMAGAFPCATGSLRYFPIEWSTPSARTACATPNTMHAAIASEAPVLICSIFGFSALSCGVPTSLAAGSRTARVAAQHLLDQAMSFKVIGDYLEERDCQDHRGAQTDALPLHRHEGAQPGRLACILYDSGSYPWIRDPRISSHRRPRRANPHSVRAPRE